MIVLTITRTIVLVILWSTIQEVHTNGPHLNTLFVDIGQLYPRADFAGVLIDLNVDQAIARGKAGCCTSSDLTSDGTADYRSAESRATLVARGAPLVLSHPHLRPLRSTRRMSPLKGVHLGVPGVRARRLTLGS